jgi:signal recognition particle receptor subunit alpha
MTENKKRTVGEQHKLTTQHNNHSCTGTNSTIMLESLTIFSKGGLILYQFTASPSLFTGADDAAVFTRQKLNDSLISKILLDPSQQQKSRHIVENVTIAWQTLSNANDNGNGNTDANEYVKDCLCVALYPDIMFEGPRQYLSNWCQHLLTRVVAEYQLFAAAQWQQDPTLLRPDPKLFDKTFSVLLEQSKTQKPPSPASTSATTTAPGGTANTKATTDKEATSTNSTKKSTKEGKEKRNWHDGNAKVTDKAMAALDNSKQDSGTAADGEARALQEARAAYLPDASDLAGDGDKAGEDMVGKSAVIAEDGTTSWSSSVTGLMQQLTGNKQLTASDLEKPLLAMEELLTTKNVAQDIAHKLCQAVQAKLVGKKLNSLYRVQTAVQQALETTLTSLLKTNVDLLRSVVTKRGDKSMFSRTPKRPYVIAVVGINGVGKSTSLAKLAYYFKENGCSPLLVAGDTFRSGAVEQLKVHSQCLDVPLYSQGYSKDPSAVAKAAIEHATEQGNDLVLIDTAGRMQNNVPLMKALGKLVQENQPDFCILVCEALVGHDGLSQFQMFQQAVGKRGIDGLILTKFDTVSDKVGAALTLTHQTGAPIVFCGTGQKYHHLKKLSAPAIIQSLFQ